MEKERVALSDGSSKVQRPSETIAKPKRFDSSDNVFAV